MKTIVDEVIQRNAYFCHVENILFAMLTDQQNHIRQLACRRILAAREVSTVGVRMFRVPKVNFAAQNNVELIDWTSTEKYVPPVLKSVSKEQLQAYISNSETTQSTQLIDFPKFPCHTQGTARCIRLVTEAAAAVWGQKRRDRFIRARMDSRRKMKSFETKSEYCLP